MRRIRFLALGLLMLFAQGLGGEGGATVQDPEEFARKCEAAVSVITKMPKASQGDYENEAGFIARHLGSTNEKVRQEAVRGLRRILLSNRPAAASICMEWLDEKYPADVRSIALASALWSSKDARLKKAFEDLVCGKVSPPNIDVIGLSAHGSWDGFRLHELIPNGKKDIVVRRLLATLSGLEAEHRYRLLQQVLDLGEEATADRILEWYSTEPNAAARSVLFDPRINDSWKTWNKSRNLLELGMADWDQEIIKRATEIKGHLPGPAAQQAPQKPKE